MLLYIILFISLLVFSFPLFFCLLYHHLALPCNKNNIYYYYHYYYCNIRQDKKTNKQNKTVIIMKLIITSKNMTGHLHQRSLKWLSNWPFGSPLKVSKQITASFRLHGRQFEMSAQLQQIRRSTRAENSRGLYTHWDKVVPRLKGSILSTL